MGQSHLLVFRDGIPINGIPFTRNLAGHSKRPWNHSTTKGPVRRVASSIFFPPYSLYSVIRAFFALLHASLFDRRKPIFFFSGLHPAFLFQRANEQRE
jgi:hypothetical protein